MTSVRFEHRLRLFSALTIALVVNSSFLFHALPALAFDYSRYQAADLDELLARKRPKSGVDLYPAVPLKLKVTLAAYGDPCQTGMLIKSMTMAGIFNKDVAITRCIQVRSPKGRQVRMFIQDAVSDVLPKEVPLGSAVMLFVVHMFTGPDGPGLLVNEYSTGDTPPQSSEAAAPSCGCGSPDFHPGIDATSDVAGAPVQSADDGVVVKVETSEKAVVDMPNIGRCGRYVVIKHSYPNGHIIFTRYAQLGRVVDADGQLLTAGTKVGKQDKIAEIGNRKILHFEIRPVVVATMDNGADWTTRYGSDPSMEWSRYPAVDPQTFDLDKFAGTSSK